MSIPRKRSPSSRGLGDPERHCRRDSRLDEKTRNTATGYMSGGRSMNRMNLNLWSIADYSRNSAAYLVRP